MDKRSAGGQSGGWIVVNVAGSPTRYWLLDVISPEPSPPPPYKVQVGLAHYLRLLNVIWSDTL